MGCAVDFDRAKGPEVTRLRSVCLLGVAATVALAGCGQSESSPAASGTSTTSTASTSDVGSGAKDRPLSIEGTTYPLTVTDAFGEKVTLNERPKRVAMLTGTSMSIWYDLGGAAAASVAVTDNIKLPEQTRAQINALPKLGQSFQPDLEALAAAQPDLVIADSGLSQEARSTIQRLDAGVLIARIHTYEQLEAAYRVYGTILGGPATATADQRIAAFTQGRKQLKDKVPGTPRSVAIVYVTAKNVALKLDQSIAGDMVSTLGIRNIASGRTPDAAGSETTPMDLEFLAKEQPDVILVTSMIGSNAAARETMDKQLKGNPAWSAINAVRDNKIVFLPQQYFLYNPGSDYVQALGYIAHAVYPDTFPTVADPSAGAGSGASGGATMPATMPPGSMPSARP